jgi:hypothetical protein
MMFNWSFPNGQAAVPGREQSYLCTRWYSKQRIRTNCNHFKLAIK